jgi:hypothetical protein
MASQGDIRRKLESFADLDAQTTVTDFLDFTEYLSSDIVRSLNHIGKMDQKYVDSSMKVDKLTTIWGQLPSLPADERPAPAQLRADISEQLSHTVNTRISSYEEAKRMAETINQCYNKVKVVLANLQTTMENFPTDEQRGPTLSKSLQLLRSNIDGRSGGGDDSHKVRRQRVPKITVPGEVLAPYDEKYDTFTDDSDISSDEESKPAASRKTPAPPKIHLVNTTHKSASRTSRPATQSSGALGTAVAAHAAALLNQPAEHADHFSPSAVRGNVPAGNRAMKSNMPVPSLVAGEAVPQLGGAFITRRQDKKGESGRNDELYKNVTVQRDGLFHCPWERKAICNHKATKLKCIYE